MKKLEELVINPTPWTTDMSIEDDAWVEDAKGNDILRLAKYERKNAHLIAAAPELYEALRDAVDRECTSCHEINDFSCNIGEDTPYCKDCHVKLWRAALAKAAGEDAK